jgi:SAM-dependent methyltransferase
MNPTPANWQLPPGVNRNLWDYLHDPAIARGYDDSVADCRLMAADLDFIQKHCPNPGSLLDLGCGTGRILLPLAGKGYWVVGVDLSDQMLKVAWEKAAAAGLTIRLLQANLVDLAGLADESFDHGICMFSTLGMVVGARERRRAVNHVYRVLRRGGTFILHVHNLWSNLRNRHTRRRLVFDWMRSLLGRGRASDCVMPAHLGIGGLTLHLFTRREATKLLRAAGFRVREVHPLSSRADGRLPLPALFGRLRAFGYLIAASKPAAKR